MPISIPRRPLRKAAIGLAVSTAVATLGMVALSRLPAADVGDVFGRIDALYAELAGELAGVPAIDGAEAVALGGNPDVILLDVREPEEIAVSRLPGAILPEDLARMGDLSGKRVLVYCTVGIRSGYETQALRERGLDAVNLRGGILGWVANGGAVVDDSGAEVKRVHVYGRKWNVLPEGYTPVW